MWSARSRARLRGSVLGSPVVPDVPFVHQDADDAVERVATVLAAGGVVVLPTDTVYGLAALPSDPVAMGRLFALKGRDERTPVAVLCADASQALGLAEPSNGARVAADRWWPGPLTLVVARRLGVEFHLGEPTTTVGLRVPAHVLVRAVAAAIGPIAATSANRHGTPPAVTIEAAIKSLGSGIDLLVDGGTLVSSASTVIDTTATPWRVLRDGPISGAAVLETLRSAGGPLG